MKFINESLAQNLPWARRMRDAWGNVPSGIFSGNLFDFGSFDQCVEIRQPTEVGEIVGQHCTVMLPFDVNGKSPKFMPPSRRWNCSHFLLQSNNFQIQSFSPQMSLGVGICVPSSCTPDDVALLSGQQTIGILPLNEQIFNLFLCSRNKSQFCCSTQVPSDLVNDDTHLSLDLSSNEVEAKLAAKKKLRRRKTLNTSIDDVLF